ncbi:porin family protein [Marinoscillum furvescens]|nr:porin family protein [Marinoscillum furvescens]
MRLKLLIILFGLFAGWSASAQYWFGPKGGANYNIFKYQDDDYLDSFRVDPTYSFEVGAVMIYQATERFSVQGELFYERARKELNGDRNSTVNVRSSTANSFISAPVLFRISFGREPVHYYLSGGPKVRYWLGGSGHVNLDDFDEFGLEQPRWSKLVFDQSKSKMSDNIYAVPDANRLQFALVLGGGAYLDLRFGGRLLMDLKYTFGHSNMGFDDNPDFEFGGTGYKELFSYRNHTISATLAYLFEYDVKLQSKGMSTIKESNKTRRKKKK